MNSIHPGFLQINSFGWLILMLYWFYAGMKTKITVRKETSSSRILHVFLLAVSFALIFNDHLAVGWLGARILPGNVVVAWAGTILSIVGLAFAIIARSWLGTNWSAVVTIKKDHQLVKDGPYSLTRHPIYTGLLFGITGSAIILGELRGIVGVLLFLIAINRKIVVEENFMSFAFRDYETYKKQTDKLVPLRWLIMGKRRK